MRLAVVATLSGNDYAQNPRGMALKRLCNMIKDTKYKDCKKANVLMDKVNMNTFHMMCQALTFPPHSSYLKVSHAFMSTTAHATSKLFYNFAPHMSSRQVVMRAQGWLTLLYALKSTMIFSTSCMKTQQSQNHQKVYILWGILVQAHTK